MKVPITLVQDDHEINDPWDTFDHYLGKVRDFFAAIGMVTVAGALGYYLEMWK